MISYYDNDVILLYIVYTQQMPSMPTLSQGRAIHYQHTRVRCVAACCSVLQRVAVCCSVLQRVAVRFRRYPRAERVAVSISELSLWQRVAVCCSVLQCVAVQFRRYPRAASYGMATISRLVKIIGLFCKRAL